MTTAEILKQAEELKLAVKDTSRGANEAWVSRQNLQDLYQKLLVLDLEYALDKKVEQDLWNHAFKNQINTLQSQAKDKQNPKQPEILASLNLFLETGSGFYLQLLEELCSAFKLDLPCRRKSSALGILKEYGPVTSKIKAAKKSSCMYICQHCLVHLGDIARYREQVDQAQTYYRHAANLVPYNGQPYNQLAILEAAKGNKLSTVTYYVRSIAVKHPFPVACTNLEKFYTKITKDIAETGRKLSISDLILAFLQFNALVHLSVKLDVASALSKKILNSLPSHLSSVSFTSHQIVQVVAILLFTLHHAKQKETSPKSKSTEKNDKEEVKEEQQTQEENNEGDTPLPAYNIAFTLVISFLEVLLNVTPVKQEAKAKEYHTLPAIKIILDWLRTDPELVNYAYSRNSNMWQSLSKLLNILQFNTNQKDVPVDLVNYVSVPLPEDCDLRCFLPVQQAHCDLDFHLMPVEGLSQEVEMRLRCQRLIEHGIWLAEVFPSLNLINVHKQKSGKLLFSVSGNQGRATATSETDSMNDRKPSHRHNVAIQAIMQSKKENIRMGGVNQMENHSRVLSDASSQEQNNAVPSGKTHGKSGKRGSTDKSAQRPEAGTMVNTSTETQEPQEKHIPSDAWENIPTQALQKSHLLKPNSHLPIQHSDEKFAYNEWSAIMNQNMTEKARTGDHNAGSAQFGLHHEIPKEENWSAQMMQKAFQSQTEKDHDNNLPDRSQLDNRHAPFPVSSASQRTSAQNDQGIASSSTNAPGMIANAQQALTYAILKGAAMKEPRLGSENSEVFGSDTQQMVQNFLHQQWLQQQQQQQQKQQSSSTQQQQQQQQQPSQSAEEKLQNDLQLLNKHIGRNSEQLNHLRRQVQQSTEAFQHDRELLQRDLQQRKVQQLQTKDPRQQQQLQQIILQQEQLLMQKFKQFQAMQVQENNHLKHVQQQQQNLLHQRQCLLETQQQQQQQQQKHLPGGLLQGKPPHTGFEQQWAQTTTGRALGNKGMSSTWEEAGLTGPHKDHQHSSSDGAGARPDFHDARSLLSLSAKNRPLHESAADLKSPEADFETQYPLRPAQTSQFDTTITQSFLGNIFQGSKDPLSELSPSGAYIPTSDSEEELREVEKMSKMSAFESREPDKSNPAQQVGSSLFPQTADSGNTYSLFSQSPWTVQLKASDQKSHASSPFGSSSNSSLRTTPDPHAGLEDHTSTGPLGGTLTVGYSRAHHNPSTDMGWPASSDNNADDAKTTANVPVPAGVQSFWGSEVSPLQKLIEQQKNQRQNDPH